MTTMGSYAGSHDHTHDSFWQGLKSKACDESIRGKYWNSWLKLHVDLNGRKYKGTAQSVIPFQPSSSYPNPVAWDKVMMVYCSCWTEAVCDCFRQLRGLLCGNKEKKKQIKTDVEMILHLLFFSIRTCPDVSPRERSWFVERFFSLMDSVGCESWAVPCVNQVTLNREQSHWGHVNQELLHKG